MSRFGNLELDGASELPRRAAEESRDEDFLLKEARERFSALEFQESLRAYSRAAEYNPNNPAGWVGQVRALIELGNFAAARLWANKALERFPREAELLAAKAVALARLGELESALALSDAAIEERGETPYAWLARGEVLLARREGLAEHCFEKALGLAAGDWFIAWLGARIRCFYKQFVAALKLLRQALEWDATQFSLWLELGQCQLALGMAAPAELSFQRALELNPDCSAARLALIRAGEVGPGRRLAGFLRGLFAR